MGKKSKRVKRSSEAGPSHKHQEEETLENLRFEDPFPDEYEVEDFDEDAEMQQGGDAKPATTSESKNSAENLELIQSWHPLMDPPEGVDPSELKLEMDPSAYKLYHAFQGEWPCLSFDILRDDLGEARTRFPHSLFAAISTQAPEGDPNSVTILRLSDLCKLPQEDEEEDILESDNDNSDEESDDDEEDLDLDPVLEHYSVPHGGAVNRLRSMPHQNNIVATWSDQGVVNMFDVQPILQTLQHTNTASTDRHPSKPFFSYSGHATEGYAMGWSTLKETNIPFATGDCAGGIHLWNRTEGGGAYEVNQAYQTEGHSVEDICWSPTEATVFATAECSGYVRIYDTRAPNKHMVSHSIDSTDINVCAWNPLVSNLLATGSDSGTLSVWDLRQFGPSASTVKPLARFTAHKSPISSVEWHPTDDSMLSVTDDRGTYIYDLSVEVDDTIDSSATGNDAIPPQLLFCHAGSTEFKECHWHPQIPSLCMTTAVDGFSVFIPSNL